MQAEYTHTHTLGIDCCLAVNYAIDSKPIVLLPAAKTPCE